MGIDKYRQPEGIITVLIALIVITPLCGLLFHCGCTWPWAGLAKGCNYFDKQALVQCPWCNSIPAGGLSVSLSIGAAYFTSVSGLLSPTLHCNKTNAIVVHVIFALAVFLLIAVTTGWVAANSQGYPHFIFTY